MSTRTRPPELDEERYRRRTAPPSKRRRPPAGPVRTFGPLALGGAILAGLLIGFLIGGSGGDTKTVTAVKTVTAPSATTAADGTAPSGAASRATIALAVLNGSGVDGLAGQTAAQAKTLGYTQVTEGNAPPRTGPSIVYYRGSGQAEARQVADDLGIAAAPKRCR